MALTDIRVVELGSLPAASYCSRVFADFGADVIKVELPNGDPGRFVPPLVNTDNRVCEGAYFGFLNVRKRSVVVDPRIGESVARVHNLLKDADVLIDSLTAAQREEVGINHDELRKRNPSMIIASTSWFGEGGPYRYFAGTDSVCRALAGLVHLIGPEAGPPVPPPDYQAAIFGGLTAFIATMAALQFGDVDGGRRIEISVLDATLAIADYNIALSWSRGGRDKRLGVNKFLPNFPFGIYACKSGWIGVTVITPVQWKTFCKLLEIEDIGTDPQYLVNRDRLRNAEKLEARFVSKFLEKTAKEWFEIALELRLPFVVVPDMDGLLKDSEHRRRGVFEKISHNGAWYEAPRSPIRLELTPPRSGGAVPMLGEHQATWLRRRCYTPTSQTMSRREGGSLPLKGVRVVDLSMGWAGPHATRHLADLGADVIKIEACQYPDWWRGVDNRPVVFEKVLYEKSPYFMPMNRNKRGVTLDLTTPDGVHLVKRLTAEADIVIENYSAGVLPKLGLDYETLRKVNDGIIMVSMPAFAADGPFRECRAYGSTLEQASGLPSVSGRPDGPPAMSHIAYGDPIGGLNAASALVIALFHRRRSGRGQHINLSQVECMLPMVAPWIIEQSAKGVVAPRWGTRHPAYVPHGSFRCTGDDDWVLVAVTTDDQWRSLCRAIGRKDLEAESSLSSFEGRRERETEIEQAIDAWTRTRSSDEAMLLLQRVGIPAGVVRAPYDLICDPHLCERGHWDWIDHPFYGRHPQPTPAYRDDGARYSIRTHAPTLGQHNQEVLGGLLKIPQGELDRLAQSGVIGTKAVPPSARRSRAAGGVA